MRTGFAAMAAAAAALVAVAAQGAPAQKNHVIEAVAENGAGFVIDGNLYRVADRCDGWRNGDRVVFADGSTAATCGKVQLTNLDRGSTCRLECR